MDMVLSVMMLVAVGLVATAIWLWRRGRAHKQVWLMLVLAVVMIVNVLIWPKSSDTVAVDRAAEGGPAN